MPWPCCWSSLSKDEWNEYWSGLDDEGESVELFHWYFSMSVLSKSSLVMVMVPVPAFAKAMKLVR